jgi:peptidoglycan/xylan/chitin deacetylase (PgdA/CDA1 family)
LTSLSPDNPLVYDSISIFLSCYDQAVMFGWKRELLARGLYWSGATFFLGQLPERSSLLALNYHRIGNPDDDLFDPGVFAATGEQLSEQISYLKRHVSLVTLEEALAFVDGAIHEQTRRCRVLMTFDDGYLDNYEVAFPILRSHGVQGVFFLVTSLVGSCYVPWWDHIAYLMKTALQRRFRLGYPADLIVDVDGNGMTKSLWDVLNLYKRPENTDPVRFIRELREEAKGNDPPSTQRRFLNWDEAREMIGGGMAIGSHTHSHHVLSQLEPEQQRQELAQSRALLREKLGIEADALAYPVGGRASFSEETQQIAREVGYRAAFSFHGGINLPEMTRSYDVKRVGVDNQSRPRFRVRELLALIRPPGVVVMAAHSKGTQCVYQTEARSQNPFLRGEVFLGRVNPGRTVAGLEMVIDNSLQGCWIEPLSASTLRCSAVVNPEFAACNGQRHPGLRDGM